MTISIPACARRSSSKPQSSNSRWSIAGIDEAGRGPWAGPVVAAAVILDPAQIPDGIDDSKALDADERERIYALVVAKARFGVGIADVARIDRDNILNATLWAMSQAVSALGVRPRLALIDGNKAPPLKCASRTIVKVMLSACRSPRHRLSPRSHAIA